jgi:hypothetical protein
MKRTVELFSSNTQLIFAQNGKLRNLHVLKEVRNQIQSLAVCVRSKNIGVHRARVTAVDINAHEIIEQYLIEVEAGKPQV